MQQLICPSCGKAFKVDETGYAEILKQVRNSEFEGDLRERLKIAESEKQRAIELAEVKIKSELDKIAAAKDSEIQNLKAKVELVEAEQKSATAEALSRVEKERDKYKFDLEISQQKSELAEKSLKDQFELQIKDRDEAIERLRDMKAQLSTKMVGETLEQHCETEFNAIRATAFPNAYFEKDNDSKSGSKGDFIFRDKNEADTEIVSIMFEMKNESDTTKTKKKNEDFYAELDKDRNEKKCEYAVLVSMLEPENELFNRGILDVSYKYPKMYVVRPQFFIPIIGILRNAASNSMELKNELALAKAQQSDITDFEETLDEVKTGFDRNYKLASKKFEEAIAEIDKAIEHLQDTKDALLGSDKNLRLANDKLQDVSIKKLTKGNPTMQEKFAALKKTTQESLHFDGCLGLVSTWFWSEFTQIIRATPVCHNLNMTIDALEDGQICTYCGTPVFFHGEGMTDCPGCGAEWVNAEFDLADELDGPAVDEMEFDNDPDTLEIEELDDSEEFE